MNVAIEIPDDVARLLQAHSGKLSRAVLEAVAIEAYRTGAITPAQVKQMLGQAVPVGNGSPVATRRGLP
jgi:chromosome segregation and condensation protein ScpB